MRTAVVTMVALFGITLVSLMVVNHRVELVSKNLDDIHKDMIGISKSLYNGSVTNMSQAYGEMGYLNNEIDSNRDVINIMAQRINHLEQVLRVQNKFVNYMLLEEMGSKDFKNRSSAY